jgi:hypothetical protein
MTMARILVIDDDPDMRALLEQTLKSAGHDVALPADGIRSLSGVIRMRPLIFGPRDFTVECQARRARCGRGQCGSSPGRW